MSEADANPVDPPVGTGQHLQPQPIFFDNLTRQRNVPCDL